MVFETLARRPVGPSPRSRTTTEHAWAVQLQTVLRRVPAELQPDRGATFPLLGSLSKAEGSPTLRSHEPPLSVTSALLVVASQVHSEADERRTAEYLLRHRAAVIEGRRSPSALLFAARFAAEMETRRLRGKEIPATCTDLTQASIATTAPRTQDASVAEVVAGFLERTLAMPALPELVAERLATAVTIALEVSNRHHARNGRAPSVIAMRPDARRDARLVTHLRAELGASASVDLLSRMLTGADGSPIDTSLLWWAAQGIESADQVPATVRTQWERAVSALLRHGVTSPHDLPGPVRA